jgi:hypothetical protein
MISLRFKLVCFLLLCFYAGGLHSDNDVKLFVSVDTNKIKSTNEFPLDKDEAIKCSRADLLGREFVVIGDKNFPEILRITFQDLERGSREIIFRKKLKKTMRFVLQYLTI